MLNRAFYCLIFLASMELLSFNIFPQDKKSLPEMSVAGIKLGDRASGKAFLDGYSPRRGEDGKANYFFWNKHGTQVMRVTAASDKDPHFVIEIEVFRVSRDYQLKHFYLEKIGFFETENGIYIGYKQTAQSVIFGFPGAGGEGIINTKDLIRKKGEPGERIKDNKKEILTYRIPKISVPGETANFSYAAVYEFSKDKLKRFILKIDN